MSGRRRHPSLGAILAAGTVVAVALAGFLTWTPTGQGLVTSMRDAVSRPQVGPGPATLLFGTNLTLYDAKDQVLDDPATQQLLKQARVPIIRMPFRSAQGNLDEVKALRAIQYVGAIPLVIVHGPDDPTAAGDDAMLMRLVINVFGDSRVYVEFGNEPDLAGFDAAAYAKAWNDVVPGLKAMAPHYQFVGPSTSAAEPAFIGLFDRLAKPRPDANTWHEYACTAASSNATCLGQLTEWRVHVQWINGATVKAIGTRLPSMITEWNLDAAPDSRMNDADFMRQWTETALHALRNSQSDGLLAALQYCAANNTNFSLIAADNSLTPEGATFFGMLAAQARPHP